MPGKPNITSVKLRPGDKLAVDGVTDDQPLPQEITIFLEKDGVLTRGAISAGSVTDAWSVEIDGTGFKRDDMVNTVGLEIRTDEFQAITWTQRVKIE
jgi:hypothetical protein